MISSFFGSHKYLTFEHFNTNKSKQLCSLTVCDYVYDVLIALALIIIFSIFHFQLIFRVWCK